VNAPLDVRRRRAARRRVGASLRSNEYCKIRVRTNYRCTRTESLLRYQSNARLIKFRLPTLLVATPLFPETIRPVSGAFCKWNVNAINMVRLLRVSRGQLHALQATRGAAGAALLDLRSNEYREIRVRTNCMRTCLYYTIMQD